MNNVETNRKNDEGLSKSERIRFEKRSIGWSLLIILSVIFWVATLSFSVAPDGPIVQRLMFIGTLGCMFALGGLLIFTSRLDGYPRAVFKRLRMFALWIFPPTMAIMLFRFLWIVLKDLLTNRQSYPPEKMRAGFWLTLSHLTALSTYLVAVLSLSPVSESIGNMTLAFLFTVVYVYGTSIVAGTWTYKTLNMRKRNAKRIDPPPAYELEARGALRLFTWVFPPTLLLWRLPTTAMRHLRS